MQCAFNYSIASVRALAIQKRHFVDHLLVAKRADGRSGVFCCSVRILLLIIVRLHQFSDNVLFRRLQKKTIEKVLLVYILVVLYRFIFLNYVVYTTSIYTSSKFNLNQIIYNLLLVYILVTVQSKKER